MAEEVADKRKVAEKRKSFRVRSGNRLIMLMREHGTRGSALEVANSLRPVDRRGKLIPNADFPASAVVTAIEDRMYREENGEYEGMKISPLTLDKVRALVRQGWYEPPNQEETKLVVSDEFADEEYDPEEDEDGDEPPPPVAKRKPGRPKKAEPAAVPDGGNGE